MRRQIAWMVRTESAAQTEVGGTVGSITKHRTRGRTLRREDFRKREVMILLARIGSVAIFSPLFFLSPYPDILSAVSVGSGYRMDESLKAVTDTEFRAMKGVVDSNGNRRFGSSSGCPPQRLP